MDDFISKRPEKIPFELYSEYEDRPFHTCTRCCETLMDMMKDTKLQKYSKMGKPFSNMHYVSLVILR